MFQALVQNKERMDAARSEARTQEMMQKIAEQQDEIPQIVRDRFIDIEINEEDECEESLNDKWDWMSWAN